MSLISLVPLLASLLAGGPAPQAQPGSVFRDCDGCPEMVVVPAGQYQMGGTAEDDFEEAWEWPRHPVTIARPLAVGRFEVTFDEWDQCVAEGGCAYRPDDAGTGRGRRPVFRVTYVDIQSYLRWLSLKSGHLYRLPSEAEWEYLARAGTTTRFYTGQTITLEDANFADDGSGARPVGSYPPNPFGLYDMAGNVWEQVEDCMTYDYVGAPSDGSPRLDGECSQRVQRGGSFAVMAVSHYVRSAHRSYQSDSRQTMGLDEIEMHSTGFRVVREL